MNYKGSGGFVFEKIHPATYLMILAPLVRGGTGRNAFSQSGLSWLGLIGFVICVLWSLLSGNSGFSAIIVDIFVGPALLYIVQRSLSFNEVRRLGWIFLILALVNFPIVVAELVTHNTLYNAGVEHLYVAGLGMQESSRPAGLFEHPLMAGPVCICAMLLVKNGLASRTLAFVIMLILLLEVAFLSVRLPLMLASFVFAVFLLKNLNTVRGQIVAFLIALAAPIAVYALVEFGIFNRVIERGVWDESAASRLTIYNIFDYMSQAEILWGVDTDRISNLLVLTDNSHIESFFIIATLNAGIIFSLFYVLNIILLFGRSIFKDWVFGIVVLATALSTNAFASKGINVAALVMVASFLWQMERSRLQVETLGD